MFFSACRLLALARNRTGRNEGRCVTSDIRMTPSKRICSGIGFSQLSNSGIMTASSHFFSGSSLLAEKSTVHMPINYISAWETHNQFNEGAMPNWLIRSLLRACFPQSRSCFCLAPRFQAQEHNAKTISHVQKLRPHLSMCLRCLLASGASVSSLSESRWAASQSSSSDPLLLLLWARCSLAWRSSTNHGRVNSTQPSLAKLRTRSPGLSVRSIRVTPPTHVCLNTIVDLSSSSSFTFRTNQPAMKSLESVGTGNGCATIL